MDISVVVCTYNRAHLLVDTVQALSVQDIPPNLNWEMVLVDNNSNDKTAELISELSVKFPAPLRYIFESQQGQSFARNRGIAEARGEIIAFTDDDVIPEKNWISYIWQVMTQNGL